MNRKTTTLITAAAFVLSGMASASSVIVGWDFEQNGNRDLPHYYFQGVEVINPSADPPEDPLNGAVLSNYTFDGNRGSTDETWGSSTQVPTPLQDDGVDATVHRSTKFRLADGSLVQDFQIVLAPTSADILLESVNFDYEIPFNASPRDLVVTYESGLADAGPVELLSILDQVKTTGMVNVDIDLSLHLGDRILSAGETVVFRINFTDDTGRTGASFVDNLAVIGTVVSDPVSTSFTDSTGDHLWTTEGNWDTGVPLIGSASLVTVTNQTVEMLDGDENTMDGLTTTFSGSSSLLPAALELDEATVSFSDTASLSCESQVALGYSSALTPATLNWSSTGELFAGGTILLGRKGDGVINQTAGTIGSPTTRLRFGSGVGVSDTGEGTYNLSGGTVVASGLEFVFEDSSAPPVANRAHAFNFTAGSTGRLIIAGGSYTAALQGFIDAGFITVDGVTQTPGDYSAFSITSIPAAQPAIAPAGPDLSVSWFGVAGQLYVLESSSDLASWNKDPNLYAGADALISVDNPLPEPGARIFFRQTGVTIIELAP
jgi:hypothetical protein